MGIPMTTINLDNVNSSQKSKALDRLVDLMHIKDKGETFSIKLYDGHCASIVYKKDKKFPQTEFIISEEGKNNDIFFIVGALPSLAIIVCVGQHLQNQQGLDA